MKPTLHAAIALALLVLVLPSAPAQTAQTTIAGTVLNALTGEPLARANVAILSEEDSHAIASVESAADGHFSLSGLPAAKYQLTAARRGFQTVFYDEHGEFSSAIVTAPDANGSAQDTSHLAFRLTPNSVLYGNVTGDSGDPVAGASVLLFLKPATHDPGQRLAQAASATTDDTGAYEFGNLAAGSYLLAVKADPWYALHPRADSASSPSPLDVAYPVTYYDSTTDEDSAQPIQLAGGSREEADLVLHAVPALHLVVEAPRNQAGSIARPELRQFVFGTQIAAESAGFTDAMQTGTTEFTGVAPGQYELQQGDPPRLADLDVTSSQQVDPSLGAPLVPVSGTLRTPAGAAHTFPALVTLTRLDSPYGSEPLRVYARNGAFSFPAPAPSEWQVAAEPSGASPAGSLSILSTNAGGLARPGDRFSVRAQPLSLSVTISPGAARVQGFARKDAKGFSGAMIVLVPTGKESASAFSSLLRRDQSDSDGSFSLRDVVPGSYSVIALAGAWQLDWSSPRFLARFLPAAVPVAVTPDSGKIVPLSAPVPVQTP
jgi:hypothetical protein